MIREGELVLLEVDLTTYPERFNVDEINKATGCFDANGTAIGVFKVKMKEGFSKNQYISSFYFTNETQQLMKDMQKKIWS